MRLRKPHSAKTTSTREERNAHSCVKVNTLMKTTCIENQLAPTDIPLNKVLLFPVIQDNLVVQSKDAIALKSRIFISVVIRRVRSQPE